MRPPKIKLSALDSLHDIHQAAAGWCPARGHYVQCALLAGSAGDGGQTVSDGGRQNRSRFDRANRVSGYYSGAGAGGDFWVCWIC